MPKPSRCTYKEGRRRCPYDGDGEPVLCKAHRIALAEVAKPKPPARVLLESLSDLLQGKPINREATLGAAEDFINQWASGMGANYRPDITGTGSENSVHRHGQSGHTDRPWWWTVFDQSGAVPPNGPRQSTQPPPPSDPNDELRKARRAARIVLGFTSNEIISVAEIRSRHRVLVRKNHPDLGGNVKKMAAINAARDVLMAELES